MTTVTSVQLPKVLVVGDWIVDDNWVASTHAPAPDSKSDTVYYIAQHHPHSETRELAGAGRVASLVYSAVNPNVPYTKGVYEGYAIEGIGVWDPADDRMLRAMLDVDRNVGRSPYHVTKTTGDAPLSVNTKLHNLGPALLEQIGFFPSSVWPKEKLTHPPRDKYYGTPRVWRTYQRRGAQLNLVSRFDWDLFAPSGQHGAREWLSSDHFKQSKVIESWSHIMGSVGKLSAVLIKDLGKGVVSRALIEQLAKDKNCSCVPWYISTRSWAPSWLDVLKEIDVRLVVFTGRAMRQYGDVSTWLTDNGKVTKEAIEEFQKLDTRFNPPANRRLIVGLLDGLRSIALVNSQAKSENLFIHADREAKGMRTDVGVGFAAALFSAMSFGLMQDKAGGQYSTPIDSRYLFEDSVRFGVKWMCSQFSNLNAPELPSKPSAFRLGVFSGSKPVTTGDDAGRLALACQHGKTKTWKPDELPTIGPIDKASSAVVLSEWEQAMDSSVSGVIISVPEKPTFQPWRAAVELNGFVCCMPEKRKALAVLRRQIDDFDPESAKHPLAGMLISKPGTGKTLLVQRLVDALGLRSLKFNVTTLTRREDIHACFDRIASEQADQFTRNKKLLVFFDEINARLDNQYVYDAFLAPLEDNYYLREGSKYNLKPCVWLFAGTAMPTIGSPRGASSESADQETSVGNEEARNKSGCGAAIFAGLIRPEDNKAEDFESRLTMEPVNLVALEDVRHLDDEDKAVRSGYLALEKVYLGVALARHIHPDLHRIKRDVLDTLRQLKPGLTVRDVRRFVEKNLKTILGSGQWKDRKAVADNKTLFVGNELQRPKSSAEEWIEIVDEQVNK
jgi:hypothetical protein